MKLGVQESNTDNFFFFFSFASMSVNLIAALDLGYLFLSLVEYYTSINRWGSC